MSKHHWTSQKITTVRESINDTKLTQVVHYITKDRTMVGYSSPKATTSARKNYEERNLKKFGKGNKESGAYRRRKIGKKEEYGSLSEKNAAEMMAAKKKPTVKKATAPKSKDKLTAAQMKAKLERANRDNKRGLTKAEARAMGLTAASRTSTTKSKKPISPREAAAKLRADKKIQSDAVAKEAKRKVKEKKKTDIVDTAAATIATTAVPVLRVLKGRNAVRAAKTVKPKVEPKVTRIPGTAKEIKPKVKALPKQQKALPKQQKALPKQQPQLPPPTRGGGNRVKAETTDRIIKAGGKIDRRRGPKRKGPPKKPRTDEMTMKDIGMRKGGLVKGIDGIAKRGRTRATRSR